MKISNIGMLNRKGMVCSTLGLLKGEIVWMGGNDRVTEGVWSWTGGKTSWNYTNWRTGTCTLLKLAVSFCTDTIDSTHLEKFIHADEIFQPFFWRGEDKHLVVCTKVYLYRKSVTCHGFNLLYCS